MKPIWPAGRNTTTPAQLGLFGAFDCDPGPAWGTDSNRWLLGGSGYSARSKRFWGKHQETYTIVQGAIPTPTAQELKMPDACINMVHKQLHVAYAIIVVCFWAPYFIAPWTRKTHELRYRWGLTSDDGHDENEENPDFTPDATAVDPVTGEKIGIRSR